MIFKNPKTYHFNELSLFSLMVRIIHCMIFIFAGLSCGYCLELQNCSTNQQWSQSNHEYLIKFSDNAKIITSDNKIELNDKTLPLWNSLNVKDNGRRYTFFRVPDNFPFYRITLNKNTGKRFYSFAPYAIVPHTQEKSKTAGPEIDAYGIVMNEKGFPVITLHPENNSDTSLGNECIFDLRLCNKHYLTFIVKSHNFEMLDPLAGFYYIDLNDKKLKKVDLSLTRKALKNDKAIPDIHEFFIDSDFNKYFFMYEYDPSQISPAGYPFRTAFVKLNKNDKPVFIFDFNSYIRIDDIYLESMDKEKHIRPAIFDKDPHVNAAIIDSDGNYLLECRHASCIIKVDSKTGKVLWQLGGKRNQFKPIGDDFLWFAGQHSPILLKNGNIAIYDNQGVNGNKKSRMVIYKLDEANRTVRQVYEYPINSFSAILGNVQELDNDSFLISTGFTVDNSFNKDPNIPQFFEINKDKEITFSMQFDGTDVSTYRCFEFKGVSLPVLHLEIKNK